MSQDNIVMEDIKIITNKIKFEMKDKIEITQADLLTLMKDKVEFLLKEYRNLHEAFKYEGRGKVKTDPLKVATSHESYLKEEGDIKRLIQIYNLFNEDTTKKVTK